MRSADITGVASVTSQDPNYLWYMLPVFRPIPTTHQPSTDSPHSNTAEPAAIPSSPGAINRHCEAPRVAFGQQWSAEFCRYQRNLGPQKLRRAFTTQGTRGGTVLDRRQSNIKNQEQRTHILPGNTSSSGFVSPRWLRCRAFPLQRSTVPYVLLLVHTAVHRQRWQLKNTRRTAERGVGGS